MGQIPGCHGHGQCLNPLPPPPNFVEKVAFDFSLKWQPLASEEGPLSSPKSADDWPLPFLDGPLLNSTYYGIRVDK